MKVLSPIFKKMKREYYGRGPMRNDEFIIQTGSRGEDEQGYCDEDLRMTRRGRAYFRMKSLNLRIGNPMEGADTLPPPSITQTY